MADPHPVILVTLARGRQSWPERLTRWSSTGAIGVRVRRCLTGPEVQEFIAGHKGPLAVLVEQGHSDLSQDLMAGCASDGRRLELVGSDPGSTLSPEFSLADILALILSIRSGTAADLPTAPPGCLVAVLGPGGTGASTVAVALAQALSTRGSVLLADLCRVADQRTMHGLDISAVGLPEVLSDQLLNSPSRPERPVAADSWHVTARDYWLLGGLPLPWSWTTIRPSAISLLLNRARQEFQYVVADVDGDIEGVSLSGSIDVEERNALSRVTLASSCLAVLVGRTGLVELTKVDRLAQQIVRERLIGPDRIQILTLTAPRPDSPRLDNPRLDNPRLDNPRPDNPRPESWPPDASRSRGSRTQDPRWHGPWLNRIWPPGGRPREPSLNVRKSSNIQAMTIASARLDRILATRRPLPEPEVSSMTSATLSLLDTHRCRPSNRATAVSPILIENPHRP